MADITQPQDGAVLHFLKETPAWCIIALFAGAFLIVWNISHDDFIPRIIDGLIGALLTSIVAQRPKGPTNIDTLNTPAINADSMDNTSVTAGTVNLNDKETE